MITAAVLPWVAGAFALAIALALYRLLVQEGSARARLAIAAASTDVERASIVAAYREDA